MMKRRYARRTSLFAVFFLSGCEDPAAPNDVLKLPLTDRIVFESDRTDPLGDIFVMTLDGDDVRRLTGPEEGEACPQISPDGNWIAYLTRVSAANVFPQTYQTRLMRANGTERRAIGEIGAIRGCPLWARTSDAIAISTITSVGAPTAVRAQVFDVTGNETSRFDSFNYVIAAFSHDGTEFLASLDGCGPNGCALPEVVVMMRNGGSFRHLTGRASPPGSPEGGSSPSLSPDGSTVVYICRDDSIQSLDAVCTVTWDGSVKTLIASNGWWRPRFSPDGTRISFVCGQVLPPTDLCVIDIDGSNLMRWAVNAGLPGAEWTADGSGLVFVCAERDICTVDSGDGTLRNLTQGHGTNTNLSLALATAPD
jgi:dipeptidyl aminopeptidase/acylaminoacyl peptidase